MARVEVHEDRVVIRLTRAERVAALRRRDITLDRSAITSAVITADPWVWLRGVRAAGSHVPGTLASGTWRSFTGRDFVLARKGRDAVVIDLEPAPETAEDRGWVSEFDSFSRVILSTVHAAELVRALRLDDGSGSVTLDTD
ncbi:hypothetical protein [Leucobacter chromiireducens]|uniref:Uncharacterized protein n=1 Tax=Leucobacter chromiireducens subsp. chromiireducens TaxID=660067 RepID=A0ABS1SQN9_9MICO|nr:hypothetical protein [Leucobacter chromiireducens]MBL3690461.1 hypothetical protein [Leucobacter chromiireducens subsp. chromiireducens]